MLSHPEAQARSRYSQSFQSSIFEPAPGPAGPGFVPAGKRRDQTTSELFGGYDEKDLRAMPKTFVPKADPATARDKKQQFLTSEVLPRTQHAAVQRTPRGTASEAGFVHSAKPAFDPYHEEEAVDANLRRQEELKSKLFGRETPAAEAAPRGSRLTPNDFNWHSIPETWGAHGPGGQEQDMSHGDRAYREKCSALFEHRSPESRSDYQRKQQQQVEEDHQGDLKRRNNVYYSDLFGRSAEGPEPAQAVGGVRQRTQSNSEGKIIVHQDWTDSKTELMHHRSPRPEQPYLRKSDELHQTRIFGVPSPRAAWQPQERLGAVTHDNSDKLKEAQGRGTQHMHQAHLRTSLRPTEFYEDAEQTKHWEVKELHLSGLGIHADDGYVRNLCQGFDLQLVKVAAEVDPVRNLCKGRAKVMVRYNPKKDGITELVRKLEDSRLKVEM